MLKNMEEKRTFPRVKANLKLGISKNISGQTLDLSETGLNFNCPETITSPKIEVRFAFPDDGLEFKTDARLVWKRSIEDGSYSYGVEFIDLKENQKAELRRELIKTQIQPLLDALTVSEVKQQIEDFFLRDMLVYISEIIKLVADIYKIKNYSEEIEKRIDHLHTQILLKGYCLEEMLSDKAIMQKVKDNFRQLVGAWIYKSEIVKRAFEKPRGYPGDYRMIETVYDTKPLSKNIVGIYFDNNFLKSPYAVAVRIRKDRLREMLLKFINEAKLNKVRILDIACGSCRELKELLPNLKTKSQVVFSCLDWDEEALDFSRDLLLPGAPKNTEFKFIKEDIMNIAKSEAAAKSLGQHDFIYSIGLIDYLPDRVLKKLILALYNLLPKGGQLVLTHKNKEKTFPPIPPDWFCDWKFVPRNKKETIKLFYDCGMAEFFLSTESDDFGYIFYFRITKK